MKRHFGFISSQIGSRQAEKEGKKIRSEYHFRLTLATAFPKKKVKKLNKKCHFGFIFSQIGPGRPKKKKNHSCYRFYLNQDRTFQKKNSKKL